MFLDTLHAPDVLLALDGDLAGNVKSAYVYGKHSAGTVYFNDGRIVQGRVDFLGHVGDDAAMIQQRVEAIRADMGKPFDAKDTREATFAAILERLAHRVRLGEVTVGDLRQTRAIDKLPVGPRGPEGHHECVFTGVSTLSLEYSSAEAVAAYEARKAEWAKENPENVVEYVRGKREGKLT